MGLKQNRVTSITIISVSVFIRYFKKTPTDGFLDYKIMVSSFHAPLEGENGNLTKKARIGKMSELKRFYAEFRRCVKSATFSNAGKNIRNFRFEGKTSFSRQIALIFKTLEFPGNVELFLCPIQMETASLVDARFNGDFTPFQR